MKFGMCNEMFEDWKIEDVFWQARNEGYNGVEIAPFTLADSVVDIPAARRAEIKRAAEGEGVEIIGLHWLLVKPAGLYVNHPDDALRQKTQDYFLQLIDCCGDLGGKVMVIGSPKQRNVVEGQTYEDTWKRTVDLFRGCLPLAEVRDVTLCFEPLAATETNFVNTADEGVKMVREINHPNFKVHLDVKAMSGEGEPIDGIVRRNIAYAGHFHANDANLKGPGMGVLDFVPIFGALKESGYNGYVSVEVFIFEPDPVTIARQSIAYMKKCLSSAKGAA
ncbi:MAG: sugar phosphate isomerase/epimerase [Armatimonadetes bacterium]|nr:sugar phosphate isomerase/epimerase [Armatimonadota bacterium]